MASHRLVEGLPLSGLPLSGLCSFPSDKLENFKGTRALNKVVDHQQQQLHMFYWPNPEQGISKNITMVSSSPLSPVESLEHRIQDIGRRNKDPKARAWRYARTGSEVLSASWARSGCIWRFECAILPSPILKGQVRLNGL